jgi:hypothetical protein
MRAELKKIHRDAVEDVKRELVPTVVLAYQNVHGVFPQGWPPWEFEKRLKIKYPVASSKPRKIQENVTRFCGL